MALMSMNCRKSRSRPVSVSAEFAMPERIFRISAEDLELSIQYAWLFPVYRHPGGYPSHVHLFQSKIGIFSCFVYHRDQLGLGGIVLHQEQLRGILSQ